jgi:threonyl-tRNA synthetase
MPVIEEQNEDSFLFRVRHSLAHVMAQAVQALYPGTKLGFGPAIDDGFYYDFILPRTISDADLPAVEEKMREIIREGQSFHEADLPLDAADAKLNEMGEPFKAAYARELVDRRGLTALRFYRNGPFVDMCEGPHVTMTSEIPADGFKLHSIAGAYWRGDERNAMMTRIYGYAYLTAEELKGHVEAVEQAKQRDHRKLGAELRIFAIRDEIGKGLPLWLPNGTAIRGELEKLAYEMEFQAGYHRVATPHIAKGGLYVTSGHLPLYESSMYPPMVLDEEGGQPGQDGGERYYLKPMNCPHHHMVFAAEKRSYRDLPLRLAEYGAVYRFERAGALQGLTRVRGFTMNDAHLYVTPDQLKDEFKAVMELHRRYYELFGFKNYYLRLSLWDPEDPKRRSKYVDDPESWAYSEKIVRDALEELGLYYKVQQGEAAFYGPKVDFQFESVIGREFTLSTNQLDFAQPPRFELHYTDKDGKEKTPYCIHRAPLGTHERFIAFLLEHYGGAFPTWLAPVQAVIIPVSDKFLSYAREIEAALRQLFIRTELDASASTMGKKIQEGATRKIPMLLVVGGKEEASRTVTVRRYGIKEQRAMSLETFIPAIQVEIRERRHVKEW